MPAIPYAAFAAEIVAVYTATKAPATARKMRTVLTLFGETPGVRKTSDLNPPKVADFLTARRDLNPHTLKGYLGYLRAASNYALARRYVSSSPFDAVKTWVRRLPAPRIKHHSFDAVSRVFSMLETESVSSWEAHRLFALFATVALTGMRKSEALYLQCQDFDVASGILYLVPRAKQYKTAAAEQPIPCPDRLAAILEDWSPRTASAWLFPGKRGRVPWTGGAPGHKPIDRMKAAGDRAGVPGLTFLSLRHTWATMAESRWQKGEALIQRNLRHSRPMTQRHYRHADLQNLRAAVADIHFDPEPRPETDPQTRRETQWQGRHPRPSANEPATACAS